MADNKRQLLDVAHERYGNEDVANAVVDDAERLGNIDAILNGDLNLPGKVDAQHWYDRKVGLKNPTAVESSQQLTIQDLQRRLRVLETRGVDNPADSNEPVIHNTQA